MGWMYTSKEPEQPLIDFFREEFPAVEVLDLACAGPREAYLAVRRGEQSCNDVGVG